MYSKIIQPGKQGRISNNKGSSASLIHYLGHEAKENNTKFSLFNANRENISAREALYAINNNVKGLRKNEVKFYSLVISPSHDELKHMLEGNKTGNSTMSEDEKLKLFTKKVMENYGANFNLKNGTRLSEQDLCWYGVIHHHRQYKGNHPKVRNGEAIIGTTKPGLNAHVHIIVAKRDFSQKITLNPQGSKERFEIKKWQAQNEQSFDLLFNYSREVKKPLDKSSKLSHQQMEGFNQRISTKLSIINDMLEKRENLSQKEVEQVAAKKGYSHTFFFNLSRLETSLRKGQPVYKPLHLLEYNRDHKPERLQLDKLGVEVEKAFKALSTEKVSMQDELSIKDAKPRFRNRSQFFKPGVAQRI